MSATIRNFKTRIMLGDEDGIEVTTDVPVRIQEQLEQGGTFVAEFNVNEPAIGLVTNIPIIIDHINQGVATEDGYEMKRIYTGVINRITAVSYPQQLTVTCTGPLALLRKTPSSDINLTGKTDIEAVRYILDYCDVPFDDSDIDGWGYGLGVLFPVYWKANQSGQELINELDEVFGCATIEIGEGRVVRFPYSRVPYDYDSGDISKTWYRGQIGGTYYAGERDRGDIDSIQNVWSIQGVSWDGDDDHGDDGCHYTIFGTASTEHPKLGAGVEVRGEFQSDFIQSTALAGAIAIRNLRYYCREPDTIRIDTSNDGTINVGDIIALKDEVYGMDLVTAKRYLVLNITREGDFMTIDGVGGQGVSDYDIVSGVEKCCGTQQDDGTCVDDNTNDHGGDPNPGKPPDSATGHCDPIANPSCIPGDDYSLPPASDVDDPLICDFEGNAETGLPGVGHSGVGTVDCATVDDAEGTWHHRCFAERG